jgi:CRISPR/Cas system-associated endonuclease Cas3-HD
MGRRTLLTTVLLLSTITAVGAFVASAFAQKPTAAPVSQPQDKLAAANEHVKDLILLMDADQNGKVSRQEWMSFMEAEFNRLDKNGRGELDVKDLLASRLSVTHVHPADSAK